MASHHLELADEYRLGAEQAAKDLTEPLQYRKASLTELYDMVDKTTKDLMKDILKQIQQDQPADAVFEAMAYRLRFLCEYVAPKAYWYGYVKTCFGAGIKELEIDFGGSDDAKEHKAKIVDGRISLEDIPAYHAYCDCKVVLPQRQKGEIA